MWNEIQETLQLLDMTIAEAKEHGYAMNLAEVHYYSVKDQELSELAEKGVSATLAKETIKGKPRVNDALLDFRNKQIDYDNAREGINAYKLRIRVLEAQLEREWSQAKRM